MLFSPGYTGSRSIKLWTPYKVRISKKKLYMSSALLFSFQSGIRCQSVKHRRGNSSDDICLSLLDILTPWCTVCSEWTLYAAVLHSFSIISLFPSPRLPPLVSCLLALLAFSPLTYPLLPIEGLQHVIFQKKILICTELKNKFISYKNCLKFFISNKTTFSL